MRFGSAERVVGPAPKIDVDAHSDPAPEIARRGQERDRALLYPAPLARVMTQSILDGMRLFLGQSLDPEPAQAVAIVGVNDAEPA